jgi:2-dehydro-3-deoxyphosphogluconate aldolase / (4S)-4-hydroxy-2-oxoglutarate aldolase
LQLRPSLLKRRGGRQLIPTNGVSLANAKEFLEAGAFALGVGAGLADEKGIHEGRAFPVTEIAMQYKASVREYHSAQ